MILRLGMTGIILALLTGSAFAQDRRPEVIELNSSVSRERSQILQRLRQTQSTRTGQSDPTLMRIDQTNLFPTANVNRFVQRSMKLVPPNNLRRALGNQRRTGQARQIATSVMQFKSAPTPEQRATLRSQGLTIEEFIGGTNYLVSVDTQRTNDPLRVIAGARANVEAASLMPQNLKIKLAAMETIARPGPPTNRSVFIRSATGVSAAAMRSAIGGTSDNVQQVSPGLFKVQTNAQGLQQIASIDSVFSIDAGPPLFSPLDARSLIRADVVQGFSLQANLPFYQGPIGRGIKVAIFDEAIDQTHLDLPSSHFFVARGGGKDHGTNVASIIGGSGEQSEANGLPAFEYRGIAPGSLLGEYPQIDEQQVDLSLLKPALAVDGSDLSNHSYVETLDGYGAVSALIDDAIHGTAVFTDADGLNPAVLPARPQTWAAGNNGLVPEYGSRLGYYSVFTQAKNSISVGSIDVETGKLSNFSSLGPTLDGRIKPDLVAPGCFNSPKQRGVWGALSGTQGYGRQCGTSQAAPHVAGIVAMMMEQVGNKDVLPSTYKALLIQTAVDQILLDPAMSPVASNPDTKKPLLYGAGPDFATGFGLVDAEAAVELASDRRHWSEGKVGQAESSIYCMDVPDGLPVLKATLAWDDPPGSTVGRPINLPTLVNDLSLELIAPNGEPILPWTLLPPPGPTNPQSTDPDPIDATQIVPAARGIDSLNNVEMASISEPMTGRWKVRVSAAILNGDGPQKFSIAANRALASPCN